MRMVWQLVAVTAVAFVGGQGVAAVQGKPWLVLALGLVTAVLSVLVYGWVVRRTERRPAADVARKGSVITTGRGTLVGIGLFAAVIVNIAFLGGYHVHGLGSVTGAVGLLGFMAAAAATEEVMFRGVLLRITEERAGTWIAMALNSVLFGLWHMLNPDASWWGAVSIMIGAGTMLSAAYIATRSLWLPIGLHFGWNFAASAIFSTEVSGNDTAQGILEASTSGPMLVSGGAFGPEASLYAVLFPVLGTIVFLWLAHRRGRLVPRRRADRVATPADVPQ